jgi:hexokinase
LFNYLAESVDAFLTKHATTEYTSPGDDPRAAAADTKTVHLGFTFSFPVEQSAIDSGKLLTWTKGFNVKGVVGQDVVKLLQDAFDRKHMNVRCVALVNDTVGTLLSRSYTAGGCVAGCIFGTGTNGAYVEQVANIPKLKGSPIYEKGGQMIINCEWGAFNNSRSHLPSTPADNALDRLSINPKFQAFEKFISGMYLGELVRQTLVALIDASPEPLLFSGHSSPVFNKQYGFDTSVMSAIEEAWIGQDSDPDAFVHPALGAAFGKEDLSPKILEKLERIRQIIVHQTGVKECFVSLRDALIVRWACSLVARRSAHLSGVAISAVLIQQGYASLVGENKPIRNQNDKLDVGVDGSLVELYPNFTNILRESLRKLVGDDVESRVQIGLAKDGSGVGAALGALVAVKHA